jgi:hypothetical protein
LGHPATTIHFTVTYLDGQDRPAASVRVLIDGQPRAMKRAGTTAGPGVRYDLATKLSAGRHRIRFEATSGGGAQATAGAGLVWIKASAGPTRPGAGPGAKPGASPDATPGGGAPGKPGANKDGPSGADASGSASRPSSSADKGGDRPDPTGNGDGSKHGAHGSGGARADAAADGSGTTSPTEAPTAADRSGGVAPGSVADTGDVPGASPPDSSRGPIVGLGAIRPDRGGPTDGSGPPMTGGTGGGDGSGGDHGASGGPASPRGLELIGVGGGLFDQVFRVYPVMITTGGTAVVWAAFVIFGKRRRDGEPPAPDEVLAAQAAIAMEPIPAAALIPAARPSLLPPGVEPDEADLPRWRRPSLLQARKTDPLRSASVAVSLSFADAGAGSLGAIDGGERRRIRYRLVRLLDVPDEASGRELGVLDAGDEVQIVEAYGIYRLVLCPDGRRGWLHKMVIGDLVEQDPADEPAPDGIDEDVLAAFLTGRQQTA